MKDVQGEHYSETIIVPNDTPQLATLLAYFEELKRESPRGAVLITASVLEDHLKTILKAHLIEGAIANKLIDEGGPLATFSARSGLAYSLGLISKDEYKHCDIIRRIRNEFAHNLSANFTEDKINDLCNNLNLSVVEMDNDPNHKPKGIGRFNLVAASLIMRFTNRALHVSKRRAVYLDWPY